MIKKGELKKDIEISACINNFARISFLNIADYDYISARTLFRNGLFDQFLTLSSQAIEKYLKTILLYNRVKNNKSSHNLIYLFKKCKKYLILNQKKKQRSSFLY